MMYPLKTAVQPDHFNTTELVCLTVHPLKTVSAVQLDHSSFAELEDAPI